ncbi:hypothetical protein [Brenneria rubrifaciens]|uniref:hypothetical protein n=1 Tax=Brenneria rubrifaciens TaxID=55213 RepID=UPI001C30E8E4|nr:hypothetical protein [Brenneria rubrifaciens]
MAQHHTYPQHTHSQQHKLQKGSLGLWSIIFFVIAAASPLTGVVGGLPVAFMAGNGAGVPGVYVLAGLLLIIFSFGFIAMSRYIVNAGAFYAYIAQGLGTRSGIAGLSVALLAYTAIQLTVGMLYFDFGTTHKRDSLNQDARELDLYLEWAVNDHLIVSPLLGLYKPKKDETDAAFRPAARAPTSTVSWLSRCRSDRRRPLDRR